MLSQLPLAVGLQPGWQIDLAGVTSGSGSLTIGLTLDMLTLARNAPGAIVMTMDESGLQIPTASGFIDGYNEARVATTTLTLVGGGTSLASVLPTVFDEGGGDAGELVLAPTAVPEPSTPAMMLAAVACGAWFMWRRRNPNTRSAGKE